MLLIGFILLTLTAGSGVLFPEQLFGKARSLTIRPYSLSRFG